MRATRSRGRVLAVGLLIIVVLAVGIGAAVLLRGGSEPAGPPAFLAADALALDEDVFLGSIAPDGRHVIEVDLDQPDRVCLRALRDTTPVVCSDLLAFPDTRRASWSADGTRVVVADDVTRFFDGGDLLLFDVTDGAVALIGDTVPMDRARGDDAYRVLVFPALSPDGGRIAALLLTEDLGPSTVVVHDLDTGEEQRFDLGDRWAEEMLWSPDGSAVWVNSSLQGDRAGALTRIDIASGDTRSIDGFVDLGGEFGQVRAVLVQISDDERIGLLAMHELLMRHGVQPNVPYLALVDLETGVRAPLLPLGPDDPQRVEHSLLTSARLRSNGDEVVFTYHADRLPERGDPGPFPVRLAWLPTADVLNGVYDGEVVIEEDLGGYLTIEQPVLTTFGRLLQLSVIPESDQGIVLPFGSGGLFEAEALLVVELDRRL